MVRQEASSSAQSARIAATRVRSVHSNTTFSAPRLSRVFSGHHLDDQYHYHKEDDGRDEGEANFAARSGSSVDIEKEDDQASRSTAAGEGAEIRDHTINEHDVEAPLEKVRTTRSVKDPDLVCSSLCWYYHNR